MKIHVICKNASGEPDIFTAEVEASAVQLRNGDHYDTARGLADAAGYEETLDAVCVDEQDHLFRRILPLSDRSAVDEPQPTTELTWDELVAAVKKAGVIIADDDQALYLDAVTDEAFGLKTFAGDSEIDETYCVILKKHNTEVTVAGTSVFVRTHLGEMQMSLFTPWRPDGADPSTSASAKDLPGILREMTATEQKLKTLKSRRDEVVNRPKVEKAQRFHADRKKRDDQAEEAMWLAAEGMAIKKIAEKLGCSHHTLRSRINRIWWKRYEDHRRASGPALFATGLLQALRADPPPRDAGNKVNQ